jgi:hypothetical protein
MERDGVEWTAQFYFRKGIDKRLCKKLMWVYADRFIVKNSFCSRLPKRLLTCVLQSYLLCDRMTRWMSGTDDSFHAVLYMNSQVAAFASGILCKDKRIILSRLAMLTKFAKYSPGGMLIVSIIRHIIAQNASGAMDIAELDFSQGGKEGMSYKKFYGGQVHRNYLFYD